MGMYPERRATKRYAIERSLRYRIRGVRPALTGAGTTVNLSSTGVLFTTEQSLPPGKPVVLEIHWPVLLDEAKPLKLVTRGRIVWCDSATAAMRIEGWEFRTQGANGF
ncbi:MAG: PilZ domain-containing protein [Bryobacteraceae bacterium]